MARQALASRRLFNVIDPETAFKFLSKLEWARKAGGSERQLDDVRGVVQVCGERLDRAYLEEWSSVLGVADLWQAVAGG